MIDNNILKNEERAVLALRSLYRSHGYQPFCMSKFEEYDLYAENKDFLVGDSVITFNDTDGRLLALKPDVTLSIIKNSVYSAGCKMRVYYDENVYRISGKTHRFKEITQTGLECIGDIDLSDIYEVLMLALGSLASVSDDFILDISHMGLFSAVLDSVDAPSEFKRRMSAYISEKNRHEALALCDEYELCERDREKLLLFLELSGEPCSVLKALSEISDAERADKAYKELSALWDLLSVTKYRDRIRFDFSVLNSRSYYSGILFRGFVSGIYESVLSGGEYTALLSKMGREGRAIGFALYLDTLDELDSDMPEYDVDVLMLYGDKCDPVSLISKKEELIGEGLTVSVQKAPPAGLKYRSLITLD